THGEHYTRIHVLFYTLMLTAVSLLPYAARMSHLFYLLVALTLDLVFVRYAVLLVRSYSDILARKTFRYSIVYLALIFAALLIDHYLYR
ncbi:MAG: protoheme IX farnesyltransferase, partial [Pseudomonadota bacterium]|nr:protoheme IX farnesyltransferase [Pseudomonadota bacterium]